MGEHKKHIDHLDSEKRNDDTANAIDQDIQSKYPICRDWPIFHALQCQRDKGNNNKRIEYDRT